MVPAIVVAVISVMVERVVLLIIVFEEVGPTLLTFEMVLQHPLWFAAGEATCVVNSIDSTCATNNCCCPLLCELFPFETMGKWVTKLPILTNARTFKDLRALQRQLVEPWHRHRLLEHCRGWELCCALANRTA